MSPPVRSSHGHLSATAPNVFARLGLGGSRLSVGAFPQQTHQQLCELNLRHVDVLVHLVGHFSDGSVVFIWTRRQPRSSMRRKRIESSSDTRKKLTSVSFPSNNGGLPRPFRSFRRSASSSVDFTVSDIGFLVGAVGISILL